MEVLSMVQNNSETGMTRALGNFAQALEYEERA